jgi:hypothetical protein
MEKFEENPNCNKEIKLSQSFNKLNTESNPIFEEIINLVKSKMPPDSTIVYISITGGRAKGIVS